MNKEKRDDLIARLRNCGMKGSLEMRAADYIEDLEKLSGCQSHAGRSTVIDLDKLEQELDLMLLNLDHKWFAQEAGDRIRNMIALARATPQHPRPTDDELWDATLRDRDQYHEWADKLAGAIAIHFGVDIGEHSNQNCPWAEALDAIEYAARATQPVGQQAPGADQGSALQPVGVPDGWEALSMVYNEDMAHPEEVAYGPPHMMRRLGKWLDKFMAQEIALRDGMVLAPHFRGYAHLGIGAYVLNHSAAGEAPELSISVATETQKAGRAVGDLRDNEPGELVQAEDIAVRLRFESTAGLDALEQQLRFLRAEHFGSPAAQAVEPAGQRAVGVDLRATLEELVSTQRRLIDANAEIAFLRLSAGQAAAGPVVRQVEELFGEYWELAYSEGQSGCGNGEAANAVLGKLRALFAAPTVATAGSVKLSDLCDPHDIADVIRTVSTAPTVAAAGPVATIDTPEFRELLAAFKNSSLGFDYKETLNALIAHIYAAMASPVGAGDQGGAA